LTDEAEAARQRLARLSPGARRLADFVAVLEGGARYALLRHLARLTEEDMVQNLREAVEAGILGALPGQPNTYGFTDEAARRLVLAEAGTERLSKLRARAEAARRRIESPEA